MPTFAVSNKFAFCGQPGKNPICRRSRYITKRTDICVHDVRMCLQELLNLPPAHCCFIHRSIAHFITRTDCVNERCFDG